MIIKYLAAGLFIIILITSCNRYSKSSKENITYNKSFFNWRFDSIKMQYKLTDYPLGVRKLYPVIKDINFNKRDNLVRISGEISYPSLNNQDLFLIEDSQIAYATPKSKQKLLLKKVREIGKTDSDGRFIITIMAPPSRFFLLFSKDTLCPSAIEFKFTE